MMMTNTNRNNANVYISVETEGGKEGETISQDVGSGSSDLFTLKVWKKQQESNNPWLFMGYLNWNSDDMGKELSNKWFSISEPNAASSTIYSATPGNTVQRGSTGGPKAYPVDPNLEILATGLFFNLWYNMGDYHKMTSQTTLISGNFYWNVPVSFALMNPLTSAFAFFPLNKPISCNSSETQRLITDLSKRYDVQGICDPVAKVIVPATSCMINKDCFNQSQTNMKCNQQNLCQYSENTSQSCNTSLDCTKPNVCIAGRCQSEQNQCDSSTDCTPPNVCINNACGLEQKCTSSSECKADQNCENGTCVNAYKPKPQTGSHMVRNLVIVFGVIIFLLVVFLVFRIVKNRQTKIPFFYYILN